MVHIVHDCENIYKGTKIYNLIFLFVTVFFSIPIS